MTNLTIAWILLTPFITASIGILIYNATVDNEFDSLSGRVSCFFATALAWWGIYFFLI